jgi:hypothetical protein
VLSQTPPHIQKLVNLTLAPGAENYLLIGMMAGIYKTLRYEGLPRLPALAIAIVAGSGTFAFMHGTRTLGFYLLAFAVMTVFAILVFAEELDLFSISWLPVTLGLTIGMHKALNTQQSGGLLDYWNTLLAAPAPADKIGYLVIGVDVLTLGLALIGAYIFYRKLLPSPVAVAQEILDV